MTVTFQNVGRGDSITLEWESEGKQKIGIIDCNVVGSENPTLRYLVAKKITDIEFVLLTHPHADHFWGMREILEFCKKNQIPIKYFLHTCSSIPEYLMASVVGPSDRRELALLFHTIDHLFREGTIVDVGTVSIKWPYRLNDQWEMVFIAPSHHEISKFNTSIYSRDPRIAPRSYRAANFLSTLIMINNVNQYFLLTSDVESSVFKRELSK